MSDDCRGVSFGAMCLPRFKRPRPRFEVVEAIRPHQKATEPAVFAVPQINRIGGADQADRSARSQID